MSERHIILADLHPSRDLDDIEPYLTIIDFRAEDETMKPLEEAHHSLKLCYPHTVRGATVISFNIHCEPSPCWTAGTNEPSPFFLSPGNRVFFASMQIMREQKYQLVHAIPLLVLKKVLGRIGTSGGKHLRWSEWAPRDTRLIPTSNPLYDDGVCFSYGSRYIGKEALATEKLLGFGLLLYDFNQWTLRRKGEKVPPGDYILVNKPSTLPNKVLFEEHVETSLTFSRYSTTLQLPIGVDILCSADNIVARHVSFLSRLHSTLG